EDLSVAVRVLSGVRDVLRLNWLEFAAAGAEHSGIQQQDGRRVVTAIDQFCGKLRPRVALRVPQFGSMHWLPWSQVVEPQVGAATPVRPAGDQHRAVGQDRAVML